MSKRPELPANERRLLREEILELNLDIGLIRICVEDADIDHREYEHLLPNREYFLQEVINRAPTVQMEGFLDFLKNVLIRRPNADLPTLRRILRESESVPKRSRPALRERETLLDRYTLENLLDNNGTYSMVWRAWDETMNKHIALKVLRPDYHDDPRISARFRDGRKSLTQFRDYTVQLLEYYTRTQGSPYDFYTMKLYEPGDLGSLVEAEFSQGTAGALQSVREQDVLTFEEKKRVITHAARALHSMHMERAIHRDVSPSNILVHRTEFGELEGRLGDLDFVKAGFTAKRTVQAELVGSIHFMAPEILSGAAEASISTDIFGLTATLLYAVTGEDWEVNRLDESHPAISRAPLELQPLIRRGCAREPEKRPRSVFEFLNALGEDTPTQAMSSTMNLMAKAQGQIVDRELIEELSLSQRSSCAQTFSHATRLRDFWDRPLVEFQAVSAPKLLKDFISNTLSTIYTFRRDTAQLPNQQAASKTLRELGAQAEECRLGRLHPDEIFFQEYLIGLCIAEVFNYVGALFIDHREAERVRDLPVGSTLEHTALYTTRHGRASVRSFLAGLRGSFRVHSDAMRYLRIWYRAKRRKRLWADLWIFWSDIQDEALSTAISSVISIRGGAALDSLKEGSSIQQMQAQLVTLTQVVHWDGWGGVGTFMDLAHAYGRNPLTQFMVDHKSHTFDWHQTAQTESTANFSHRKDFFAPAAVDISDYAAGCTAVLIAASHLNPTRPAKGWQVRIWGDSVGPKRIAEGRIMENLLVSSHYLRIAEPSHVHMTLSDVSGPSLEGLLDYGGFEAAIEESRTLLCRDLNIPFPGEPGTAPNPHTPAPGSFDCYSCSVSLHQIADHTHRLHRIRNIFAFATRILREGGVISVPDVAGGIAQQAYILPTNIVDREGGWSGDFFSLQRSLERGIGFESVASTPEGLYAQDVTDLAGDAVVKLPIPLLRLWRGSPHMSPGLPQRYVYEYIPYVVIALPISQVRLLDQEWQSLDLDGRMAKGDALLEAWRVGTSTVNALCIETLQSLGYELAG